MQEKKDEGKNAGQQMMVAGPSLSRLSFWFNKLPTSQGRSQSGAPNFIPSLAPLCWIQAGPTFLSGGPAGLVGARGGLCSCSSNLSKSQALQEIKIIRGEMKSTKVWIRGPHTIGYPGSIHWSICGLNCFLVLIIKQSETCVC